MMMSRATNEKGNRKEKTMEATTKRTVEVPAILEANTWFWKPAPSASMRRANEQRRMAEVEAWLYSNAETLQAGRFEVEFSYSESCNNVYKKLVVYHNGRRSNLLALKNWLAKRQV